MKLHKLDWAIIFEISKVEAAHIITVLTNQLVNVGGGGAVDLYEEGTSVKFIVTIKPDGSPCKSEDE
jgi:hypothetical protein